MEPLFGNLEPVNQTFLRALTSVMGLVYGFGLRVGFWLMGYDDQCLARFSGWQLQDVATAVAMAVATAVAILGNCLVWGHPFGSCGGVVVWRPGGQGDVEATLPPNTHKRTHKRIRRAINPRRTHTVFLSL